MENTDKWIRKTSVVHPFDDSVGVKLRELESEYPIRVESSVFRSESGRDFLIMDIQLEDTKRFISFSCEVLRTLFRTPDLAIGYIRHCIENKLVI